MDSTADTKSDDSTERIHQECRKLWSLMREQNLLCDAIVHTKYGGTFTVHRFPQENLPATSMDSIADTNSDDSTERIHQECRKLWSLMREQNLLCDAILHTENGGTFPVHRFPQENLPATSMDSIADTKSDDSSERIDQESRKLWSLRREQNLLCDAIVHAGDGGKFPVHRFPQENLPATSMDSIADTKSDDSSERIDQESRKLWSLRREQNLLCDAIVHAGDGGKFPVHRFPKENPPAASMDSIAYTKSDDSSERIDQESRKLWSLMREQNLLCDAILHTENGGTFPVHRLIMSLSSPYFKSLFTTSLFNKNKTSFFIPGVASDVMRTIIDYAYIGRVTLTEENVVNLLIGADHLNIINVLKECCDFLKLRINFENCIGICEIGKTFFCFELEKLAGRFLLCNFVQVSQQSQEFLEMPQENVIELLNSDYINVKNEEQVWEAGIRWIDHSPTERSLHISAIMRCVRLGLLENQYFMEKVMTNRFVDGKESCIPIIQETLKFLKDLESIIEIKDIVDTPFLATPRIPYSILFAIGGRSDGSITSLIETYDTKSDSWIQVHETDPVGPRANHGLAVVGFNIYVIGGYDGQDYLNTCRCFNAVSKEWKEIAPMHAKRRYVCVSSHDNIIYSMGGKDDSKILKTAESYDHRSNKWTCITSMNQKRSDACAATLHGLIYVVGGTNEEQCLSTGEYYNPATDSWTTIAPMRWRRAGASVTSLHDHLYILGGTTGRTVLSTAERFDSATNSWSVIPQMYHERTKFAVEVLEDMIFALGGTDCYNTIYPVEVFDCKTNKWTKRRRMKMDRDGFAVCVVAGLPNVLEYIPTKRSGLMERPTSELLQQKSQRPICQIDPPRSDVLGIRWYHEFLHPQAVNPDDDEQPD